MDRKHTGTITDGSLRIELYHQDDNEHRVEVQLSGVLFKATSRTRYSRAARVALRNALDAIGMACESIEIDGRLVLLVRQGTDDQLADWLQAHVQPSTERLVA